MTAPLLIVGQGLAGTLLAWRCERAGIAFEIVDCGHGDAASRVGAGIVNPLTGRRITKSWQVDAWREEALTMYRELEEAWRVPLVRPMRVRRWFRDGAERDFFAAKAARGALAPYASVDASDDAGFGIEGAFHVDTARLIAAGRERWRAAGRLREERIDFTAVRPVDRREAPVIVCMGAGVRDGFSFVPWEVAKGQLLTVQPDASVAADVILNRGHWALPLAGGAVRVGATYERTWREPGPTPEARAELEQSAAALLGQPFTTVTHEMGWRVTTPDRHPVVGWHPDEPGLGIFGGLASKGALWAPALARQWVEHLQQGAAFLTAVDVRRFSA